MMKRKEVSEKEKNMKERRKGERWRIRVQRKEGGRKVERETKKYNMKNIRGRKGGRKEGRRW